MSTNIKAVNVSVSVSNAVATVVPHPCRLRGFTIRNSGAGYAEFTLHDGNPASTNIKLQIPFAVNADHEAQFVDSGIRFSNFIYVSCGASVIGTLFYD